MISADLDGDGRRDLIVVVAYNQWDEVAITESSTMDDVQGLVETMTIVPSVIDRRECGSIARVRTARTRRRGSSLCLSRCWRWRPDRGGRPVVALTDDGVSALRLEGAGGCVLSPGSPIRR